METTTNELFEQALICPDPDLKDRLDALIGIEEHKDKLTKLLGFLVDPTGVEQWIAKYHPNASAIVNDIRRRPPLVILEGDVGSGKSELATTIGDAIARQQKIEVTVLPLSLSARGKGMVGEMTKLLSDAFDHAIHKALKLKSDDGSSRGAIILLVDEADALTQSRESNQMNHEDKAGVNAFIRGVDRIANGKLPMAVIMCTNRLNALDPAVKRRAAEIIRFTRPSSDQRKAVLSPSLVELGLAEHTIDEIVTLTGPQPDQGYGFTFSDIRQRLLPSLVLDAYPDRAVTAEQAIQVTEGIKPTPPFQDQ